MTARRELEQLLDGNQPEWNAHLLDAYRLEVRLEAARELYDLHMSAAPDEWWGILLAAQHLDPTSLQRQQEDARKEAQSAQRDR